MTRQLLIIKQNNLEYKMECWHIRGSEESISKILALICIDDKVTPLID